ncbi:hypothetical protein BDD12DRAFT_810396 [Trichophaea hybrida]|nr:hypothetical protein BDD12DRAFT_810396 [Trichophaea hybrida]
MRLKAVKLRDLLYFKPTERGLHRPELRESVSVHFEDIKQVITNLPEFINEGALLRHFPAKQLMFVVIAYEDHIHTSEEEDMPSAGMGKRIAKHSGINNVMMNRSQSMAITKARIEKKHLEELDGSEHRQGKGKEEDHKKDKKLPNTYVYEHSIDDDDNVEWIAGFKDNEEEPTEID